MGGRCRLGNLVAWNRQGALSPWRGWAPAALAPLPPATPTVWTDARGPQERGALPRCPAARCRCLCKASQQFSSVQIVSASCQCHNSPVPVQTVPVLCQGRNNPVAGQQFESEFPAGVTAVQAQFSSSSDF
eukprot:gene14553-biopygen4045